MCQTYNVSKRGDRWKELNYIVILVGRVSKWPVRQVRLYMHHRVSFQFSYTYIVGLIIIIKKNVDCFALLLLLWIPYYLYTTFWQPWGQYKCLWHPCEAKQKKYVCLPTDPIFQPPTLTFFIGNYSTNFASDPINFYTEFG